MVSAAEQLARNINFASFGRAKELQARIWFTLGALVVYRLGTYIPLPGIDPQEFARAFGQASGGLLGMYNMFSGGAVERMAIFALNVMPYISASIIVQLMTTAVPTLERLKKEGEAGRKQINQYTRYLTVLLAIVQAFGIALAFNAVDPTRGTAIATSPGLFFLASTVITLVGGTIFLMWLGEQITARGVGNGISLIIFAGIVAELPRVVFRSLEQTRQGSLSLVALLALAALSIAIIVFIVFIERSQRRLLIQYPRRQQGNRMVGGESSFLPLKLNTSGVIPPIFASSLLLLPTTLAGFSTAGQGGVTADGWFSNALQTMIAYLGPGQPLHIILYGVLIIFFCFFYTSVVFNPEETAENLRKYGGFIPGYKPGKRTAEHLDFVLSRLTVIGAVYLTAVCLLPEILRGYYGLTLAIGGTSILIVVSVTMDTVAQIQSHLVAHQYEGMIKRARLGGRKR
ncbi:preprotein translocase subunit SecY [bacterium]|nr:preprotein translocase subunit SecY [bacterium]